MPYSVFEKVVRWSQSTTDKNDYIQMLDRLEYYANQRYMEYVPTKGPYPDYKIRLSRWLGNLSDEDDQKKLFKLATMIFFVSLQEFDSLYRYAFNNPVMHWLIEREQLDIESKSLQADIAMNVKSTWFCPITDSMNINTFYHTNHIEGVNVRPDWYSLQYLADKARIIEHMRKSNFKRLVLIEDFVGCGKIGRAHV